MHHANASHESGIPPSRSLCPDPEILPHLNKSQQYRKNNEKNLWEIVTAEHHVMEKGDSRERDPTSVIFCWCFSLVLMSL